MHAALGVAEPHRQLFTLVTIAAIAISTSLVACFYGLRTSGDRQRWDSRGPLDVVNLVVLHLIAASFTVAFYGTNLRLPIGS